MCGCKNKAGGGNIVNNRSLARQGVKNTFNMSVEDIQLLTSGDEFVDVIYNGPSHSHYIPLLTNTMRKRGLINYGLGRKNQKLRIHKLDLEESKKNKANSLFTEVIEPVKEEIEIPANILTDLIEDVKEIEDIVEEESIETDIEEDNDEDELVDEEDEVVSEVKEETVKRKTRSRRKKSE